MSAFGTNSPVAENLIVSTDWQKAQEKLTGTIEMDSYAIIENLQPLIAWLEKQNSDKKCDW